MTSGLSPTLGWQVTLTKCRLHHRSTTHNQSRWMSPSLNCNLIPNTIAHLGVYVTHENQMIFTIFAQKLAQPSMLQVPLSSLYLFLIKHDKPCFDIFGYHVHVRATQLRLDFSNSDNRTSIDLLSSSSLGDRKLSEKNVILGGFNFGIGQKKHTILSLYSSYVYRK